MHAQIITYQIKDMTQDEYIKVCNSLAPAIANQPGLIAKVWLADPSTNTFGGTYAWRDRESMEAFMHSDLVKNFASHPSVVGITSRDFEVLDEPTRVTGSILAVPV